MKLFLFFMLAVMVPLQLFSQYSLERTTHLPRPGDRLPVQKGLGLSGISVSWKTGTRTTNSDTPLRILIRIPLSASSTGPCTVINYPAIPCLLPVTKTPPRGSDTGYPNPC